MNSLDRTELFRRLPAIDKLQQTPAALALKKRWRADMVDDEIRAVVADARSAIQDDRDVGSLEPEAFVARAAARLGARFPQGVEYCINATGVVLHTGLGRAVLPPAAVDALAEELRGYSVVSIDREEGARIRRESAIAGILSALTGAEHATVVNNNAAATVITLNTMAAGKEVVISRGQLVEIGGSFRMPDVFRTAGVTLREVGATNRTRPADYENAVGEDTGLLLRVHPSNYKIIGFTSEVGIEELVAIGNRHGLPVLDDLGAGALVAMPPEPEVAHSVRAGADLLTCSGDKLIGGPQSGIILGKRAWVDKVRTNPLFRALRVDKMTLTALEATLRLFLLPGGPGAAHPTWHMLHLSGAELDKRARALKRRIAKECPGLTVDTIPGFSQVGSGSMPGESLPTTLCALTHTTQNAAAIARQLRLGRPPVYTRIIDDAVCLDPRTILPTEDRPLLHRLKEIA